MEIGFVDCFHKIPWIFKRYKVGVPSMFKRGMKVSVFPEKGGPKKAELTVRKVSIGTAFIAGYVSFYENVPAGVRRGDLILFEGNDEGWRLQAMAQATTIV